MPKNIFAYTAPGAGFPEYVSLNEVGDKVVLTIRSPKSGDEEGKLASLELPYHELFKLAEAIRTFEFA